MDPKMDSGYLVPNEQLEDEYDVSERLGAEDVVGIMDRMLCCEVRSIPDWTRFAWIQSDTDYRVARWHGIKATLCLRRCLLRFILITFYGPSQRRWTMQISTVA